MEPHITKEQILHFHNQTMNETEMLSFLSHIGVCTHCADLFAESFSQTRQLPAPANLKERILSNAPLQKQRRPVRPAPSKSRRLFFYSARVCASVCGALLITLCLSANTGLSSQTPAAETRKTEQAPGTAFAAQCKTSMDQFAICLMERSTALIVSPNQTNRRYYNDPTKK